MTINTSNSSQYSIAIVKWHPDDGLTEPIEAAFAAFGHHTQSFMFNEKIPSHADFILTFAPYGRMMQLFRQNACLEKYNRPKFIHWNFESLPNINIPWTLLYMISFFRSWVDRGNESDNQLLYYLVTRGPLSLVNRKMHKFRYLGEYHYAYKHGWLDFLFESSEIFAQLHRSHGVPSKYVPWGISPMWYSDLKLERDIDVFWMGKQRTPRRSKILTQLREKLSRRGVKMYIADDVENPLVYGDARTEFLNRAKIILNILPTWYDPAFPFRFNLAAANKSLVISDPLQNHTPIYQPNKHYISTPLDALEDTIMYYLQHVEEREKVVTNAYELVTQELTLNKSVEIILNEINVKL
jgi:hypothetical protein